MGNRYYLTGVQLGMLMRDIDETKRMEILNKIMNDQCMNNCTDGYDSNHAP